MVTMEQCRVAVGNFRAKYSAKSTVFCYTMYNFTMSFILVLFLMFLCNLSLLIFFKLLIAGDVELNPGPTYNIVKLVRASFHQGNPMFGISAGIQCACNALFSICWTKIKKCELLEHM